MLCEYRAQSIYLYEEGRDAALEAKARGLETGATSGEDDQIGRMNLLTPAAPAGRSARRAARGNRLRIESAAGTTPAAST